MSRSDGNDQQQNEAFFNEDFDLVTSLFQSNDLKLYRMPAEVICVSQAFAPAGALNVLVSLSVHFTISINIALFSSSVAHVHYDFIASQHSTAT